MASSHIAAYKSLNRIDPKVKRRIRRSEEWQNKRHEEVNKRRNIELMTPCRELDVDLSMDSSVLETSVITPPPKSAIIVEDNKKTKAKLSSPRIQRNKNQGKEKKETKSKNTKCSEASLERLKMLQKWKQERELLKKQEALERAKNKPFIVSVSTQKSTQKTNFERNWEKEQKKKTAIKHSVAEIPSTRTRATATTTARSAAPSTQRVTRQTTTTAKAAAKTTAPATLAKTKAAPVTIIKKTTTVPKPTKAPTTRTASVKYQPPAPKKVSSKVNETSVRRSTRASSKALCLPPIKEKTRNQKKTDFKKTVEPEPEQFEKDKNQCNVSKKTVSFAPDNFVFTGCVGLKPFDTSPLNETVLSPTSTQSFLSANKFESSNSLETQNFITTRTSVHSNDKTEIFGTIETCDFVKESPKVPVSELSSPKSSEKSSDCPSLDKNVDVPNGIPEGKDGENVSFGKQEPAIPTDVSSEMKSPPVNVSSPVRLANKELFKTPVSQGPKTRRMRRSLSETRFNKEKSDNENRKRRKTEMARSPQTPEEWVELLKNSPMIEMTRRKIPKEKLNAVPLTLEFSDEDLAAAEIILPSNQVGQKLPESTPQKEMETSEKPVAMASAVKNGEEVVSEVSSNVQPEQTAANTENKTVEMATEIPSASVKHDVPYFRNLVKSQTDTLNSLADEFEAVIPNVSEEVEGQIRTVIGQTKLLISKRFRQFIGLIDNCEYNTGEKETTCDDLQGFWDMVDFQVEDVRIKFQELKKLRENGWQPLEDKRPVAKKLVKKTVKKAKPLATNTDKRKGKSEFALFMAQKKKEAKEKEVKVSSSTVSEPEPPLKVFDGLFFKVESPVKSPKPHCDEISRSPLAIPTFVETDRTVRLSPTITTINVVENGEESKMDSPKMAVCPEKESPKVEQKFPSSANSLSPTAPLLPTKSLRRSFVPAIPSPLLQDITPNKRNRKSRKSFVFTGINSPRTPVQVAEQNPEAETEKEPAEKILVLQTPPRRSGRLRSTAASSPNVSQTPTQELVMQSFIKNMLSSESSSEDFQTSKDEKSPTRSPDSAPVFTPLTDGMDKENPTSRRRSRRRKTIESQITDSPQKRRRSTRLSRKSVGSYEELTACDAKENTAVPSVQIDMLPPLEDTKLKRRNRRTKSVAFSDQVSTVTVAATADSPSTVLCPVSPNVDITEDQQAELIRKSGRFQTLKVGFTPVRGSRPSLLYTPRRRSKICDVESGTNLMNFSP